MKTAFCTRCGQPVAPGTVFCPHCGSPTGQSPFSRKPVKKSHKLPVLIGIISAMLAGVILFLLLYAPGGEGLMALGRTVSFGSGMVPASGGEITIDSSGTPLDGMTITVPEGAYAQDTSFDIKLTEIKSNPFGELFNPITPLITIDNGHGFAQAPMVLTIPIDISDDEFAMAFFYDEEKGTLEGLPLIAEDNHSITVETCHFSGVLLSKALKEKLVFADSGFRPGVNDLQVANDGSAINPFGHCAGQDIAAMVYYSHKGEEGWEQPLFGRYDNDGYGATPGFTDDDAHAQRLASVLQTQYGRILNDTDFGFLTGATTFKYLSEEMTYYALIYSINMQHMPQYLSVHSEGVGGHALIAYKVTAGAVYVADPNYPGKERRINFNDWQFDPYYSGLNAEQAEKGAVKFDTCYYRATSALVDVDKADELWQKTMNGGDPGEGWFPGDIDVSVCAGKNADGTDVSLPVTDGMTLTTSQLAAAGDANTVKLHAAWPTDNYVYYVAVYDGTTLLGGIKSSEASDLTISLDVGEHDIGIEFYRAFTEILDNGKTNSWWCFLNFKRYQLNVSESVLYVEPAESQLDIGEPLNLTASADNGPDAPAYYWDYGDGNSEQTADGYASHIYAQAGTYLGMVTLVDSANPNIKIGPAMFSVTVTDVYNPTPIATEAATPEPPADTQNGAVSLYSSSGALPDQIYDSTPTGWSIKEPDDFDDAGLIVPLDISATGTLHLTAVYTPAVQLPEEVFNDGLYNDARLYVRHKTWSESIGFEFDNSGSSIQKTMDASIYNADDIVSIQFVPMAACWDSASGTWMEYGPNYRYAGGSYSLDVTFTPD